MQNVAYRKRSDHENGQSHHYLGGVGAFDHDQDAVENKRDQEDVDRGVERDGPEMFEEGHAFWRVPQTAKAWCVAPTSWVRTPSAPA